MERIDGSADPAVTCPRRGRPRPRRTAARSRSSSTRSSRSTRSTGAACGLGDLAHTGDYLAAPDHPLARAARLVRRPRPARRDARSRTGSTRTGPPTSRARSATATTSSTTCCSRPSRRRACSPSSTGRWPAIGDPLVDLAWALIFHPGPDGTMPSRHGEGADVRASSTCPIAPSSSSATRRGRAATPRRIGWYDVFARWKLAIVLEGSYAKFQRGPVRQADPRVLRVAGRPAARQRRRTSIETEHADEPRSTDARVAGDRARASRSTCCTRSSSTRPSPAPARSASG